MIRRPPRSTLSSSSAASDVYKRQVIEGLLSRKSEFVRTPKFNAENGNSSAAGKKYGNRKIGLSVYVELMMAVYCLIGICSSLYFLEIAALPFQVLFFSGFAFVSLTSITVSYTHLRA